ncbi:MAG: hypothetical protein O2854_01155 [Chloroflexi bacterium]|nr:hypothetical protein [Chloroflexota bacterium]
MRTKLLKTVSGIALIAVFAAGCGSTAETPTTTAPNSTATQVASPEATATPSAVEFQFAEPVDADTSSTASTHVAAGVPVRLKLGQQMISPPSAHTGLVVTFIHFIEDTRCAPGQSCTDPGRVAIQVELKVSTGALGETELAITGDQTGPTAKKLGRYSIGFLEYNPETERATLVVFEQ